MSERGRWGSIIPISSSISVSIPVHLTVSLFSNTRSLPPLLLHFTITLFALTFFLLSTHFEVRAIPVAFSVDRTSIPFSFSVSVVMPISRVRSMRLA